MVDYTLMPSAAKESKESGSRESKESGSRESKAGIAVSWRTK